MPKLYIISGMSGAGKSQSLKIFEDFGFFCIDNIPIQIIKSFIDFFVKNYNYYKNIVISIDSRSGEKIKLFKNIISILKQKNISYKIIFLNASNSVLLKRYSETRRRHHLGKSVSEGIMLERKIMNSIFLISDEVIDTSNLTLGELKKNISVISCVKYFNKKKYLNISIISFGYKYGLPNDSDIVYDVRFITNPNYVHKLKNKNGIDESVRKYIEKQSVFNDFFVTFSKLIETTISGYINEGKSYLTIAIGCTGGKHRSVCVAEKLAVFLKYKKYKIKLNHRDILRVK
ncbi:MAG: RNase adapter RapZ [Endomicrobium sp.]|jgi:UPF0042 nucleotide-binding protein|nr:RNase adapter RapZ [Endomicrobium sp.]